MRHAATVAISTITESSLPVKNPNYVPITQIYDTITELDELRRKLRRVRSIIRHNDDAEILSRLEHEQRSILSRIETTAFCLGADARDIDLGEIARGGGA